MTSVEQHSLLHGQAFKDAMSLLAAPVAIVTGVGAGGVRWGFTASSVVSVSLNPPRLLVAVAQTSSCYLACRSASEFVINVLGAEHPDVASRFATHGVDRFAGGEFEDWPGTTCPHLPVANAAFRCVTTDVVTVGDHDLLVAGLIDVRVGQAVEPLVWYRRTFHTTI